MKTRAIFFYQFVVVVIFFQLLANMVHIISCPQWYLRTFLELSSFSLYYLEFESSRSYLIYMLWYSPFVLALSTPCIRMIGMGDIFFFVDNRLQMIIFWKVTTFQNDLKEVLVNSHNLQFGQLFYNFCQNWFSKKKYQNSADFGRWEQEPKNMIFQDFLIVCHFLPHFYQLVFTNASWICKKICSRITESCGMMKIVPKN